MSRDEKHGESEPRVDGGKPRSGGRRSRSSGGKERNGVAARVAKSLAAESAVPTSLRAVLDYYASTGELAVNVVRLQRRVDAYVEGTIDDAFARVERAIAAEVGVDAASVSFDYDTKLTMPAELTLGHLYQRATTEAPHGYDPVARELSGITAAYIRLPFGTRPGERRQTLRERAREQIETVERAEAVTDLVVVALLDGDMRDAINDAEYEDFRIEGAEGLDRPRAAEIAQETLQRQVETLFDGFPDAVRAAYRQAVDCSEEHQDRDPHFRDLMAAARDGDEGALDAIRDEYKFGSFDAAEGAGDTVIRPAELFVDAELEFPYLKTQYGRVGVIYDGMIEMYRAAGIDIEDMFKRSIVFTIIGAQIWLDDIDDYHDDLAETQLTPVTAEYLLADSEAAAYRRVVDITETYLSTAERYAAATDSPLAGIGTNYVFHSGDPDVLPGSEQASGNE